MRSRIEGIGVNVAVKSDDESCFTGHENYVSAIVLSPDGQFCLTASWDATLCLWDTVSGCRICRYVGHTRFITGVCLLPWSRDPAAEKRRQQRRQQREQQMRQLNTEGGYMYEVFCWFRLLWSLSSRTSVVNLSSGLMSDQHFKTFQSCGFVVLVGTRRFACGMCTAGRRCVEFDSDVQQIALQASNMYLRAFLLQARMILEGHSGYVVDVASSDNGRKIVSASNDKTARVWDARVNNQL